MEVLLQGQTVWEVLRKSIETIENKQKVEYLFSVGHLPQQDFDQFQAFEKDAYIFFDSVIHTQIENYRQKGLDFPVSASSPKNEKVMFIKALLKEHNPSNDVNLKLIEQVKSSVDQIMSLSIGKTGPYLPKADLRYDEYMAIKNEFSAYNFKKNFKGIEVVVVSHFCLFMLSRVLRRAKKL